MPSFRDHLLTWLFFIAVNCIAITAVSRDANSLAASIIWTAQVYIIAAWAAIGHSHRLLRGALFFIAPLTTALAVYALRSPPSEARAVLAVTMLLGGIVFASTFAAAAIVSRLTCGARKANAVRWQFSLVELLGWTIVVAIGSAAISRAELPPLEQFHSLWGTLLSGVVAGVLVALFLAPGPKHDRVAFVVGCLLVAVYLIGGDVWGEFDREDALITGALVAIIGFWVLVVRLDRSAATRHLPRCN